MSQQQAVYKLTNWVSYNKSLVNRGDINLWLPSDIEEFWYKSGKSGNVGHPQTYSDFAIEVCLTIGHALKLPLRAIQGYITSLFKRCGINLICPDYSTLSRRNASLSVKLRRYPHKGSIDIVVDSTGAKIHGEGEWHVRKHGASKRRTWRKVHVAVDPVDQEIVSVVLTGNDCSDDHAFPTLIDTIEEDIDSCYGDGAYDKKTCDEVLPINWTVN